MTELTFPKKLGIPEHKFRLIFGRSRVDYDTEKDIIIRKKHKYALESATHFLTRLLMPMNRPPHMISDAFSENGEIRHMHMTIGDEGEIVFFVTTMREDETIRVISLRKANTREQAIFEAHTNGA